jgi:anti-sigma-K factor RskA
MDRQSAKELYSDYLEGELDTAQVTELEAFLEQDEAARAELAAFKKTLSSLYGLRAKVPTPPPDLANKVERRIQRRSRGRFFSKGTQKMLWRVPFEWISFIIILLLLALYMTTVLEGRKKGAVAPPKAGSGTATTIDKAPKATKPGAVAPAPVPKLPAPAPTPASRPEAAGQR